MEIIQPLSRKLSRFRKFQGAYRSALLLAPLPLRWGCFQRGGRSPLFRSFEGVVWRGNHEIPLQCLSLTGRGRFSLQERNGGASAQPSSWLSPILRGCPLPLLKIPTRRCFRLAHLASWLHTVPVVNGVIPPPALDVMPPEMLAHTAGFFHFLSPPNAIIH